MIHTINRQRRNILRKRIARDLKKLNAKNILDNGAGKEGSWDYHQTPQGKIVSIDKIHGDDAHEIVFNKNAFDTIVCAGIIQYLHDPSQALRECNRVLQKNGYLILSTINANAALKAITTFKNEHITFTQKGLRDMVQKAGFTIKEEEMIDFPLTPHNRKMILYLIAQKNENTRNL